MHLVDVQCESEGDSSAPLVLLHESQNEGAGLLGGVAVGLGQDEAELWVLAEKACKHTVTPHITPQSTLKV